MDQLPIFPAPGPVLATPKEERPAVANNPGKRDLRQEALDWIKAKPEVSSLFLVYARELAAKGKRFGVKLIAERVRFECAIRGWQEFKINNNHTAYMARWLIEQDPAIEKFLEFRVTVY